MVEHIIEIRTELQACGIGDPDGAGERCIDIPDAGADDHVASAVSECPWRGNLKRFRIEEA